MSMAVGIFGGGSNSGGGGGGDVRLESNHNATISENGTHVVTPNEGFDGMRKATIKVDVEAADPTDKALVQNATQYGFSHNLYKVMEQVKADPRTSGYAAIMLCQYYKGYNSLSLEGGANAFLTSDGDFYQGNAVHYWHDSNDDMFDRWVAMLFTSASGNYTCSNASICPRAALIDGTMGDIFLSANNMRFTWIDVTEGSSFGQIDCSTNGIISAWNKNLVLCGMRKISKGSSSKVIRLDGVFTAIIGCKEISAWSFWISDTNLSSLHFKDIEKVTTNNGALIVHYYSGYFTNLLTISAPMLTNASRLIGLNGATNIQATNLRYLSLPSLIYLEKFAGTTSALANTEIGWASLIHFEIGQGFYSDLNLRMCTLANCIKTDANDLVEDIVAHPTWSNLDQWLYNFEHLIVDKLADLSGQTAKTITLAAAPYAAITSEIRSKMSAKNWNLASA